MESKAKKCKWCDTEIVGSHAVFSNHVKWCHSNPEDARDHHVRRLYGEIKSFECICEQCDSPFIVRMREKTFERRRKKIRFCSKSCASTFSVMHRKEHTKTCSSCQNSFVTRSSDRTQCNDCGYFLKSCKKCGNDFVGRQYILFCSGTCKREYWLQQHPYYEYQQFFKMKLAELHKENMRIRKLLKMVLVEINRLHRL